MRFSIWPNLAQPWTDVLEVARHAEATGWDGVWLADHFMGDGGGFGPVETPMLEATAGAGRAGRGHRSRAARLARARRDLPPPGGAGQLGRDGRPDQRRSARPRRRRRLAGRTSTSSTASSCRRSATGSTASPRPARCCGGLLRRRAHDLRRPLVPRSTDALCEPKPVQAPLPLLIGGKGDRMLGITARLRRRVEHVEPARHHRRAVRRARSPLRGHRARPGRDPALDPGAGPAHRRRSTPARRFVEAAAPRAAVAGPHRRRWPRSSPAGAAAGVDEVIVPDFAASGRGPARRSDALDAIITEVAPRSGVLMPGTTGRAPTVRRRRLGYAHEIVTARAADPNAARALPESRDIGRTVSGHHPPVTDWATDFDHTDEAWAADPFPIWDELRDDVPGGPLRPLRRRVAADPPRGRRGHRLRHRALHVPAASSSTRAGRSPAPRSASPRRSRRTRRSTTRPAACCCRRFAPKAIAPLEPFTRGVLRRAARRGRRPGRGRRRRRVRPAHPGAGDRQDARLPGRGRRPVPRCSSQDVLEGVDLPARAAHRELR